MRASRVAALLILCCCAIGETRGAECPEDSVKGENGECKCAPECPPAECPSGQRPVQVKPADPDTPGSCCARYDCVLSESRGSEPCPENTVLTEDGGCECAPCPSASCQPGYRPVQVRAALDRESPDSCCPLYDCRPAESVSWVEATTEEPQKSKYCIYDGTARKVGERWQQSDCESCVCREDGASCHQPMCKPCENAIPPDPGECCPHCPPPTNGTLAESCSTTALQGCPLTCEHGYANDENDCPVCSCVESKDIDDSPTDRPIPDTGVDDIPQIFDQPTNDSAAIDEASKKICPEVKCDLHCERGLVMDENDCTFCKCRAPDSSCPPLIGCRKRCALGYKTNKRGCPICRCRAYCTDHRNGTHPEGSSWRPNSCTSCSCESGGRLVCKEIVCSVACNDPLPPKPGTCCSTCPIAPPKENETHAHHQGAKGWGTVPITLIVILGVLCLLLIVHVIRARFRGRLSPSDASYSSYPPQYYKCVPAYDAPMHRNEKIVPL